MKNADKIYIPEVLVTNPFSGAAIDATEKDRTGVDSIKGDVERRDGGVGRGASRSLSKH